MDLSESHFSSTVCFSLTSKLLQGAEVNGYIISFLHSWWIQTGTGAKLLLLPKQSQIDGSTLPCFYLVVKRTEYLVNWNQWLPACWVFPGSHLSCSERTFTSSFLHYFSHRCFGCCGCCLSAQEERIEDGACKK